MFLCQEHELPSYSGMLYTGFFCYACGLREKKIDNFSQKFYLISQELLDQTIDMCQGSKYKGAKDNLP